MTTKAKPKPKPKTKNNPINLNLIPFTTLLLLLLSLSNPTIQKEGIFLKEDPKEEDPPIRPKSNKPFLRLRQKNREKSLWLDLEDPAFSLTSELFNLKYKNSEGKEEEKIIVSFSFKEILKKEQIPEKCQKEVESANFGANWVFSNTEESKCVFGIFPQIDIFEQKKTETLVDDGYLVKLGDFENGDQNFLRLIPKIPGADDTAKYTFVTRKGENDKLVNTLFLKFENKNEIEIKEKTTDFPFKSQNFEKTVFLTFNKFFTLSAQPLLKRKFKIENEGDPTKEIQVSLKYGEKLKKEEIPDYPSCKDIKENEFNYIIATEKNCIGAMTNIYKEIKILDKGVIEIHLNWIENETFILLLKPRDQTKENEVFKRLFPPKEKDKPQGEIKNIFEVFVDKEDTRIEVKTLEQRYMRWGICLFLTIIPGFTILFFSSNFNYNGFYIMQFGVIFNFVSQITLAIIEWFGLEDLYFAQMLIIILSMLIAMYYCQEKIISLTKIWIIFSLIDYTLMALLMNTKGTIFYGLINVVVFFVLAYLIRMEKPRIENYEIAVSFALSITLLTLLGNMWYFTTSFNRVWYIFQGARVHDKKPGLYYLVYGVLFSVLSLGRLVFNEVLPWNRLAGYRAPEKKKRDLEEGFMDKGEEVEEEEGNTAEERRY